VHTGSSGAQSAGIACGCSRVGLTSLTPKVSMDANYHLSVWVVALRSIPVPLPLPEDAHQEEWPKS
jgi:hypothetical protein